MSTNIKWAYQKEFKRGEVVIGNLMGFRKSDKCEYEIVPEEAEVVKRIFREFLCGYSGTQICDGLIVDGVASPKKGQCRKATIMKMLQNEKYSGNAILGKTYKPDDNIEEILCVKVDKQMADVEEKIIELQGRAISLHRANKSGEITVEDYNAMLAYISNK